MSRSATHVWAITGHVCLCCFGRVLESKPKDGPRIFRCSNCGVEAEGRQGVGHPPICACGTRLGKRDAGVRCVPNPNPRPEMPSEIIAKEVS